VTAHDARAAVTAHNGPALGAGAVRGANDRLDASVAVGAPPALAAFNHAGVLAAADVHVARRLAALTGDDDAAVMLGAALAARAPRLGHVCVDLATVGDTVTVDADEPADLAELAWPPPDEWRRRLAASPQVAGDGDRPLRLVGTRLYLDRYWRDERLVAEQLHARAGQSGDADRAVLAEGLGRLFPGEALDRQRLAAAAAVLGRLAVVAGGPGTGKTTTVAGVLALLAEQARAGGHPPPRVALAAPTGKAATRLQQAVVEQAPALATAPEVRGWLAQASASTLHRLLGGQPGRRSRFRHHHGNRLPHDAVIVDETSMVSLSLMARLVEAVRPAARLVLVGDPHQLASVEAGAVLGDMVGPVGQRLVVGDRARAALSDVTGGDVPAEAPPPGSAVGDGIVVLRRVHRYEADSAIAALAAAIQRGDADAAVAVAAGDAPEVAWTALDAGEADDAALAPARTELVEAASRVARAARAGDAATALEALAARRLLCAHRRGPYGVEAWNVAVERWLAVGGPAAGPGEWYAGRPLLVTANDYALGLSNGDTGVAVAGADDRLVAAFAPGGRVVTVSPARLAAVETTHAMTVHKSQGSQFAAVTIVLPDPTSRLLTRELLYTAVTRATRRVRLVGTEAAVRRAVTAPIARASGLGEQLWGVRAR
jgi:exodeoxyribonuclease V alpha subunit